MTTRDNEKRPIGRSDRDRRHVRGLLAGTVRRFGWWGRSISEAGPGVSHRLAIESMQAVVDRKPQSDEHAAIQRCGEKPQLATVIEAVAGAADTTPPSIGHGHGRAPRMFSARLGRCEGMGFTARNDGNAALR